jgi:hypothetical protein
MPSPEAEVDHPTRSTATPRQEALALPDIMPPAPPARRPESASPPCSSLHDQGEQQGRRQAVRFDLELAGDVRREINGHRAARADLFLDVIAMNVNLVSVVAGHADLNLITGRDRHLPARVRRDLPPAILTCTFVRPEFAAGLADGAVTPARRPPESIPIRPGRYRHQNRSPQPPGQPAQPRRPSPEDSCARGGPGTDAKPSPAGFHQVAASLPPPHGTPREDDVGDQLTITVFARTRARRRRLPPHEGQPHHEPLGVFGADRRTLRSSHPDTPDHDNTVIQLSSRTHVSGWPFAVVSRRRRGVRMLKNLL